MKKLIAGAIITSLSVSGLFAQSVTPAQKKLIDSYNYEQLITARSNIADKWNKYTPMQKAKIRGYLKLIKIKLDSMPIPVSEVSSGTSENSSNSSSANSSSQVSNSSNSVSYILRAPESSSSVSAPVYPSCEKGYFWSVFANTCQFDYGNPSNQSSSSVNSNNNTLTSSSYSSYNQGTTISSTCNKWLHTDGYDIKSKVEQLNIKISNLAIESAVNGAGMSSGYGFAKQQLENQINDLNNNYNALYSEYCGKASTTTTYNSNLNNYTCTQFSTCSEARAALAAGATNLDKDGDGTPCETLCK